MNRSEKNRSKIVGLLLPAVIVLALFFGTVATAAAAEVERLDKDRLKAMLTDNDVVVIDTRAGMDWSSSEFKIKGAVRVTADNFDSLAGRYPQTTRLIFYCA